jgi:2-hydroxymuconate-semialdehyde hydrolase
MTDVSNPEIGRSIQCGRVLTNYQDVGAGEPVLLLHGSGPGVSAWANWRLTIGDLSPHFRLLAPDLAGFGYSERVPGLAYTRDLWLQQIVDFLDAVEIDRVHLIGNSFGGSMALALAVAHPERVNRIVLMGSVGVPFELTPGLDAVWGYEPSIENMRRIMGIFAYNQNLVGDQLVQLRYEASSRPGVQESYASMFPAPRQRWVEAMSHPTESIRSLAHATLLVHGRDDKVIPLSTSLTLLELIHDSRLHIFGQCGHWTQIEHAAAFAHLVKNFLAPQAA